jgi:cytoskeletal protein RodZ
LDKEPLESDRSEERSPADGSLSTTEPAVVVVAAFKDASVRLWRSLTETLTEMAEGTAAADFLGAADGAATSAARIPDDNGVRAVEKARREATAQAAAQGAAQEAAQAAAQAEAEKRLLDEEKAAAAAQAAAQAEAEAALVAEGWTKLPTSDGQVLQHSEQCRGGWRLRYA